MVIRRDIFFGAMVRSLIIHEIDDDLIVSILDEANFQLNIALEKDSKTFLSKIKGEMKNGD